MAATLSRHHGSYARPQKTLPISMPTKSSANYRAPTSRVASSPPELSDTSTVYSSRRSGGTLSDISGDDYESSRYPSDINVMDELNEKFDKMWDPTTMDRMVVNQAKTSGGLNAKTRDVNAMKERLARRVQKSRVNFEDTVSEVQAARADLKSSRHTIETMKARAAKIDPDAYEEARRARHSRR